MKKTILALTVTGLLATSAQAANVYNSDGVTADIYGRVQFDIKAPGSDKDVTGVGSGRFGVKGSSVVSPGLKAIVHGEWQIDSENSDTENGFSARHVYLGVDHETAGKLVFGQTDTAFYKAVAITDIFNTYGYAAFAGIEDGRQEGQVVYNNTFAGLYVGASYQFSNDDFEVSMGNPNAPGNIIETGLKLDSGYALTLGYQFAFGLDVYAGYHDENLSAITGSADGTKTNLALSAGYTVGDLSLGVAIVQAEYKGDSMLANGVHLVDGTKLFGYDLVASYNVLDNVAVYGGYAAQEAEFDYQADIDTADEFTLGTAYKLNNNAKVWAEYVVDNIDGADNKWTVAAQYNF
jgi:outer membrane protein N